MTHLKKISEDILKILILCTVEGLGIRINSGQLDRKTYDKVNDVLTLMGGNWNRAKRMHMFLESPAELLETVCTTGEITDRKKQFQFFETPLKLAERMVQLAEIADTDSTLEPSAGLGAIADHIIGNVTLIELDPVNSAKLRKKFHAQATLLEMDFLKYRPSPKMQTLEPDRWNAIVMNPPFSGKQDIHHIRHAMTMLAPGGRLVAICANGPGRAEAFEKLQSVRGGKFITDYWQELPEGTFLESGTNVRTILMRIRRVA